MYSMQLLEMALGEPVKDGLGDILHRQSLSTYKATCTVHYRPQPYILRLSSVVTLDL